MEHLRRLTQTERLVASSLQKRNWVVIRNGWPDFCCITPSGEVVFVEVKKNTSPKAIHSMFRREQFIVLSLLRSLGFNVLLSSGNGLVELHPEIEQRGSSFIKKEMGDVWRLTKRLPEGGIPKWIDEQIERRANKKVSEYKASLFRLVNEGHIKERRAIANQVLSKDLE